MNLLNQDDDNVLLPSPDVDKLESDLKDRDLLIDEKVFPELGDNDAAKNEAPDIDYRHFDVDSILESSTAMTRIKSIFFPSSVAESTELTRLGWRAKHHPLLIGLGLGTLAAGSRVLTAYDEFVRAGRMTAWRTREMAKRAAADYCVRKAMTFGTSIACRVTLLAGGCCILPLLFTAINGRSSYWQYAAGWGLSCSLYCLHRGPIQSLVAGLVVSLPGFAFGIADLAAAKRVDRTFEQLYYQHVMASIR